MKRTFLKVGATIGAVSVAVLAAGPAMAATTVSQASAQALTLSAVGNSIITQTVTATNDGKTQTKNNGSTIPPLVGAIPTNNIISAGAVVQDAQANSNSTSAACAGLAGQGATGGVATIGQNGCINGTNPVSLQLGNLQLGTATMDTTSVVGQLVSSIPLLNGLPALLQTSLINAINTALANTPLSLGLGGSLGVISAHCQANPTSATGTANITDSNITLNIPGQPPIVLTSLPAHPSVNEQVILNPNALVTNIRDALVSELNNAIQGQLAAVGGLVASAAAQIQGALVVPLQTALAPLLTAINTNIASLTLNEQTSPAPGKAAPSIKVTALDLKVLPVLGNNGIQATIGNVECGPNVKAAVVTPTPSPTKTPTGKVPTGIESGLAGGSNTGTIIAAMSVLLAAGGAAGTAAYRRYWMPRG